MIVGLCAGAALSAVVLGLDELTVLPLVIASENARVLLGATFAAVVTAGAFAFWMRPIAAQLAASAVPSPVVVGRLDDDFQGRTIGVTVGALAYEAIVLLSLPTSSGGTAPPLATLIGAGVGVAAIAGLLVAMHHAERSTRPSILVAEAARAVVHRIQASARKADGASADVATLADPAGTITTPVTGWVRNIDDDHLLQEMPAGGVARVEVDVGSFVIEGWTVLVSVWDPNEEEPDTAVMRGCFEVGDERADSIDLAGSLSQFVDIGVHAAVGGSASPSTVYETMWHLGAILHELCQHEVGVADRQVDDGRTLIRRRADAAQLVNLAVDRIRQVTASEPPTAIELVRVICDVRQAAIARDREGIVDVLDDQCDRIVAQCEHAGALPSDVERVVAARRGGSRSDRAPTRDEEYPSTETSSVESEVASGSVGRRR